MSLLEKEPKIALVFPGQGSQMVGMGLDLYQNSPQAREVFMECDKALGFPLSRLCFEGPEEELRQTSNAQPAIMTVSIACLRAASEFVGRVQPHFVAGHSLGEYTALVAAEVLEFTDAIRLARERGRLMQEAGELQHGGMAAIIGLDEALLKEICHKTGTEIANINSPNQIVISGAVDALAQAMNEAKTQGVRVVPLEVSGAFHSRLMEPAILGIAQEVSKHLFSNPKVPIVANITAQPMTTASAVKEELLHQLRRCVQWQQSVEYMIKHGVSTFIEIGSGRVLAGLIKKIDRGARVLNISDMPSIEATSLATA
jgi:[acyl-carrier-protein] S-malonyltransferase